MTFLNYLLNRKNRIYLKKTNMPVFTHIIFDLDGTLSDPRQGISNSIRYALEKMQMNCF
jgi:hypothetical protein